MTGCSYLNDTPFYILESDKSYDIISDEDIELYPHFHSISVYAPAANRTRGPTLEGLNVTSTSQALVGCPNPKWWYF